MKKNLTLLMLMLAALVSFTACSGDDSVVVSPEVTVPSGVDYFSSSMDFTASAGQKSITFTSNVNWTLTVADTQNGSFWCTVSKTSGGAGEHTVIVTVDENTSYYDRNVVVTLSAGEITKKIFVNQKAADALLLTANRFEVSNKGGVVDVTIRSNVEYEVTIPEQYKSWIRQSANAKTRAMTTSHLSFIVAENGDYDKREGEIVFSSGTLSETVKIYQSGVTILILSKNEYTVGSEGGTVAIDIKSNFDYEIDMPDVDWITSVGTRAVSSHTLTYEIGADTTYDAREAVIVFKDRNSEKKESVTIKQKQKDAIITSSNKVEIGQDGGTFTVDVGSNVDYQVVIDESCKDWIAPKNTAETRAMTMKTLVFEVGKNENYEKREGSILLKNDKIEETVKVYQSGGAILVLNQTEYNLTGDEQNIIVELKSNIDYTISNTATWITNMTTRAVSSSTQVFKIAKNNTGKKRTSKISFVSSDGTKFATVNVNQETIIEAKSLDISFYGTLYAYIGDRYNFFVTCTPTDAVVNYEWSSSNTNVLTVSGTGSNATVKIVGYGEADVIVEDKNSGVSKKFNVHSRVSGFSWNNTGEKYSDYYPMITMVVGETQKLGYTSDQGGSISNLFGDLGDFVFYEPTYVVSTPSVISFDGDGNATALKTGTVGIKPLRFITCSNNGNDRMYIKVISEYTESEYNNDFAYANTIKAGQKMKFRMSGSSDIDVFKFTKPSNGLYFWIKVTYEGDLGGGNGMDKHLSYALYNSSYSEFGTGNLTFKSTGESQSQYRLLDSSTGYIRFYINDYFKNYQNTIPTGYFTVEFLDTSN